MKKDDIKVLQEVQKNTDMAIKAIHSISGKVDDEKLSAEITRQGMRYAEIYNRATDRLMEGKAKSYQSSGIQDIMLKSAIEGNMLLNNSTGHIAEMMIQGSNRGLTDMWKIIYHHENTGHQSMEIAKELLDFEEKNIEILKKYL